MSQPHLEMAGIKLQLTALIYPHSTTQPYSLCMSNSSTAFYNEALVLNELDRRFHLYLIGGDYERMFYSFDAPEPDNPGSQKSARMARIKLDVEVTKAERRAQSTAQCADPAYKQMLDYMLKRRVNTRLEGDEDLLCSCEILMDLLPIMQAFGKQTEFDDALLETVLSIDWLANHMKSFLAREDNRVQLGLTDKLDPEHALLTMGYPTFIWLLPRWAGERQLKLLHPSLHAIYNRTRQFGRFVAGAIGRLSLEQTIDQRDKWMLYSIGTFNVIPTMVQINLLSKELDKLISQQHRAVSKEENNEDKIQVLANYSLAGDAMMDLMAMEEIIRPHILEGINFRHFDPLPYLFGYADESNKVASIFFQARAYALYRQLFKTGRIHPHETAIFLKKYKVNKHMLHELNEADFTELSAHLSILRKMIGS